MDTVKDGVHLRTEFQAISTRMFATIKAFQEYAFDGRSRASYMVRWETKTGMIWLTI